MNKNINTEFAYHDINSKKSYFEGWYYRITTAEMSIGIILGITKNSDDDHAFIQIIDTVSKQTQYIRYELYDVLQQSNPFHIQLQDNHFYQNAMILNLQEAVSIKLHVTFSSMTPLLSTIYAPTIMGPFSYLPNMECIHSICSLHHHVHGTLYIQQNKISLLDAIGYIEKDRGTSFPKNYLWVQSNHCLELNKSCFFLSVANIPIGKLSFNGFIGVLLIEDKQIRFGTYYGAKVKKVQRKGNDYKIIITQNQYMMIVKINQRDDFTLSAPSKGNMSTTVHEGLEAQVTVHLYKNDRLSKNLHFLQAGCESFGY